MTRARKICMLGDFAVGKTSLVRRYVEGYFAEAYVATAGVQTHLFTDRIETDAGPAELALAIWDIEGSKLPETLLQSYLLGSSGALVVGDVTRGDALSTMAAHARRFQADLPGRPVVFALNKGDLLGEDGAPDGASLIEEFGVDPVLTSAATGAEVTALFHALGRRILELGI
jgi:small GTP-binding protein